MTTGLASKHYNGYHRSAAEQEGNTEHHGKEMWRIKRRGQGLEIQLEKDGGSSRAGRREVVCGH